MHPKPTIEDRMARVEQLITEINALEDKKRRGSISEDSELDPETAMAYLKIAADAKRKLEELYPTLRISAGILLEDLKKERSGEIEDPDAF